MKEEKIWEHELVGGVVPFIEMKIKREGTDSMAIRKGLLSLKDFPGATGNITMLPNGDVEKPFALFQVMNGKYEFKQFMKY